MDIVITYVDGNDPVWKKDYEKYTFCFHLYAPLKSDSGLKGDLHHLRK